MIANIKMDEGMRRFASAAFYPVGRVLGRYLTPNMLTSMSVIASGGVCALYALGYFTWGGWLMLLAGVFDIWDGQVAKLTNRVSVFGAFFDSSADRVSDFLYGSGAAYYFAAHGPLDIMVWALVYLGFSQLISYVKARAESLGFDCSVGFLARGLRVMLLGIPLFIYGVRKTPNMLWVVRGAFWLVSLLAAITLVHRVLHVWMQARRLEAGAS
jgi:CDP-diacylglycerol--glycerol-3-phosphate 3-phosphatidyltransferase